ncbi:unnamed protein product [Musa acuminata subsp. malaccensis]|uniref:(wild Malaysian banana) hypothetical protein n=1 Tax=Musa acuminata subsp. malaccensis TaxID=214687 RepID=A0A804IN35_MUSAM|nr:unnamed protein product [Musa acuminata subsp. malaccensis]
MGAWSFLLWVVCLTTARTALLWKLVIYREVCSTAQYRFSTDGIHRLIHGSRLILQILVPLLRSPWPVVGNLYDIKPVRVRCFAEWAEAYGPIVSVWFGTTLNVVVSRSELAREVLRDKDQQLVDRARSRSATRFSRDGTDLIWADYGPHYVKVLKLCNLELFSSKRLDALRPIREDEVIAMVESIFKECSHPDKTGKSLVLLDHLAAVAFNTMTRLVFGKRFVRPDGEAQGHFVDALMMLKDQYDLSEDSIIGILWDMITAGVGHDSHTSGMGHGGDREEPRTSLTWSAFVKESLRLHPPTPLMLPHKAKIAGYDIPRSATVIVNIWAIARDPKTWEQPTEFRSDRFLEEDIDVKGHDFRVLLFGAGRDEAATAFVSACTCRD